jgi:hypothetical protein
MSTRLRKNPFYSLKINNNNNSDTESIDENILLEEIKKIQERYKVFVDNYTTFKDFDVDTVVSSDNIFSYDVLDFYEKHSLSKKYKIQTLQNYKKFLEFVEKTTLKEYLDLPDNNFEEDNIESKLKNAMIVDKVINDPIKLYLFDDNINKQDNDIIQKKHKEYLNYKHYYNVKNRIYKDDSRKKSSRQYSFRKNSSRQYSSRQYKSNTLKKQSVKRKLAKEKDDYCNAQSNDNMNDKKLWSFFELMNLDSNFTELCEGENEDIFYDNIKYEDNKPTVDNTFYNANINAISFYFERFKELDDFMQKLNEKEITYNPSGFTYIKQSPAAEKIFKDLYDKKYFDSYFNNQAFIEFFCNEYNATRIGMLKYQRTLKKNFINFDFLQSEDDKGKKVLKMIHDILKLNFEENYLLKENIMRLKLKINPINFDDTPIQLNIENNNKKSKQYNIYFPIINDKFIETILCDIYWSFYDKFIPNFNNKKLKDALDSFINDPIVTLENGTKDAFKYQLKLLRTYLENDETNPMFEVDEENDGDYIGLKPNFFDNFSKKLNKIDKKQIVISPSENSRLYYPVRYLFIAGLFLLTTNIIKNIAFQKDINANMWNLPNMKHLFYTKRLNWFIIYLMSRNKVSFPVRLDVSNIYDDRLEFKNDDLIINMAELNYIKLENLFLNNEQNMESKFKGMTLIPYKSNKINSKISIFYIFYFKIDNIIQNINSRKRFLYDSHINRSFGITADEIKYLLKYSGMDVYKVHRTLIGQIPKIKENEKAINYYKSILFFTRKQKSELHNFSSLLEKANVEIIKPSQSKYNKLNYKITYE